jgi:hypothetical protein
MEQVWDYILKAGIWIGIFWLIYSLFLRREIFFRFNRGFLLAGMIASFAWFYLNAVKENHEYLADREVLATGCKPAIYHAALINCAFHAPVFVLANSFAFNKHKRIKMMKNNDYRPVRKFAALLIAPALAAFLWAFAKPMYVFSAEPETATTDTVCVGSVVVIDGKEVTKDNLVSLAADSIKSVTVLKNSAAKKVVGDKGQKGVIAAETKNGKPSANKVRLVSWNSGDTTVYSKGINDSNRNPLFVVDGKTVSTKEFQALSHDSIQTLTILKDSAAIKVYGEEGKDGVIIVTKKKAKE